jgi:predicted transcriptional regulator
MATITIEVSEDVAAKLAAHARAVEMDVPTMMADIATRTAALPDIEVWDPRLSAEDIVEIKIGLQELEDGQGIPHEVVMAEVFGRRSV